MDMEQSRKEGCVLYKKTRTLIVLKGKKKGTVKVTVKLPENKKKSGEDEHETSAPTKAPNQEDDEPVRTDTPDNMTSAPQRTSWVPTITPETETEAPGQETEIPRTEEPDVVLNYSVLDNPSTKMLPSGEITAEGQKPVSGTDTFKLINGQLKGTFNKKERFRYSGTGERSESGGMRR